MRIVAYRASTENGKVLLQESTGEYVLSNNIDTLFSFLLEPYDQTLKVCWDLDATVSVFLRLLGKEACQRILKTKRYHLAPFNIFYIPDKIFSVTHASRAKCNLYGLEQYYPEIEEPDVKTVAALGKGLLVELRKMGLTPTKLTSPIAIYDEAILSKLDLPRLKDMPLEVAQFAWQCSGKLWVEAHQLGYWDTVYDYDLSSAFPNIAKDLVDIRDCHWAQDSAYIMGAIYGYVKCDLTIYDWVRLSPIIVDTKDALVSHTGPREGEFLTKGDVDLIMKWGIGEVKITDGYWGWTTRKALRRPLKAPMEKLLKYKQGSEVQKLLAKRMSTGIYGKMGEERAEEFGPYINPPWFAEISTRARLQVADYLYSNNIGPGDNEGYRHLIAIGVDGFSLDCPIEEINGERKEPVEAGI